jgi:hypothetical protein
VTAFAVSTATHNDGLAEARETGRAHGEYLARILADTPPERRAALREGAELRLRRFVAENLGQGNELLGAASSGFASALEKGNP